MKEVKIEELCLRVERLEKELETVQHTLGIAAHSENEKEEPLIPLELRTETARLDVLGRAIEKNIIKIKDGHLLWCYKSKTLLAYLCGRIWSGDYTRYDRVEKCYRWYLGDEPFPGTSLSDLFGVKGLRHIRGHRNLAPLPAYHELIDALFLD